MVETLAELFLNTVKSYPKPDLMLYKKEGQYQPISTEVFGETVKKLSLGLWELGLRPEDKLIILSENRPEWVMTDLATIGLGGVTVPIYTTLVADQIRYIIDDSDAKIVVFSNEDRGQKSTINQGEAFYHFSGTSAAWCSPAGGSIAPGRKYSEEPTRAV